MAERVVERKLDATPYLFRETQVLVALSLCSYTRRVAGRLLSPALPHQDKNKHVTEGHLTLFVNTFPNFSQSICNNHDFFLHDTQALP